jgi:hypothetical protein
MNVKPVSNRVTSHENSQKSQAPHSPKLSPIQYFKIPKKVKAKVRTSSSNPELLVAQWARGTK